MSEETKSYEGWSILELLGHRRIAGFVQQVDMFGAAMCRIDIPGPDGKVAATQIYSGSAIYCLTPTTEEVAHAVALRNQPQPVQRWEMLPPVQESAESGRHPHDDHDYEDEEDANY